MKAVHTTTYKCETCGATYAAEQQALDCEARPVAQDFGVKVGDEVVITRGDGTGQRAKVKTVFVITKDWGHYAWERYWHTVALTADIVDSWGSRLLTFDDYIKAKP